MTGDEGLSLLLFLIGYPLMSYANAMLLFGLLEDYIRNTWLSSDKRKYGKIVKILKLDSKEDPELFNPKQPKWYKLLEIIIGIIWPPVCLVLMVSVVVYYGLYYWPKRFFNSIIKPIIYWWIGKEIKE